MESFASVGIVTGANKGIGYATIRQLALQYPKSALRNSADVPRLVLYLTARDAERGQAAVKNSLEDAQLKAAKVLVADGGTVEIRYHGLDVADDSSIATFRDFVKAEHPGGIDFIINNAAVDLDDVEVTLKCNYYGLVHVTDAFLPLLKPTSHSRIVNLTTVGSSLQPYPPELRQRFVSSKTVEETTALIRELAPWATEQGRLQIGGEAGPTAAYLISKAGVNAVTRAIAARLQNEGGSVLVNCSSPGRVPTDMSGGRGDKTADEGAQTSVMLAIEDIGGASGGIWQDEKRAEEALGWA